MSDHETHALKSRVVRYTKTRISVTAGPSAGTSIDMAGAPVRIGSAAENDLVLSDNTVSRQHCELEATAGGIRVRDAGSTNGILVGEVRVYDAVVAPGTSIVLGDSVLTLTALDETVDREQAISTRFGDLLGGSARMRELFADLSRIAPTDVSLLIEGETGTGKELVAESVHGASARAEGPLIVFDCSAVAPTLAESELFGHERGAFTGAVGTRAGVFEQAQGGTIFLDELGELPKDLQPKLLRVLEKREVRRLGSQRTVPIDVRVMAATNRNIAAEVQRGNFREDLYFRIAAAHVIVPPLRDRMDDLTMLVEHFLGRQTPTRTLSDVSQQVWEMFRAYRWPGNVRELHNAVQRLAVTPDRPLPMLRNSQSTLPPVEIDESTELLPLSIARHELTDRFEKSYVRALLARTNGNYTRAAELAQVSRQMIQKLVRKHGLV
jgi:transcriptional regulator with PAS, ATPase and Fis domain